MKPTYEELVALEKRVDKAFMKHMTDIHDEELYNAYDALEKSYSDLYEQADDETKDRIWNDGWPTSEIS